MVEGGVLSASDKKDAAILAIKPTKSKRRESKSKERKLDFYIQGRSFLYIQAVVAYGKVSVSTLSRTCRLP
jgi:hypothetical protein